MGCCNSKVSPAPYVALPDADGQPHVRKELLLQARRVYQWAHPEGIPPHIKDMPEDELFGEDQDVDFTDAILDGSINNVIRDALSVFDPLDSLQDYEDFYTVIKLPAVARRWICDAEFAAQRVRGTCPMVIKRVDGDIPAESLLKDKHVRKIVGKDNTVQGLIDTERLYVCDYEIVKDIPVRKGAHATAPIAFFYMDGGRLMPLAIQLERHEDAKVFTPPNDPVCDHMTGDGEGLTEEGLTWLLVRSFVQNADAQVHQFMYHFTYTHLHGEICYIAMMRTLSERHPLHILMLPHFKFNLAINNKARTTLINKGGAIDQTFAAGYLGALEVVKRAWSIFDWNDRLFKNDLHVRRVASEGIDYPWRDDCSLVHESLEKFVTDIVTQFYSSNADVVADDELQAFYEELRSEEGAGIPGFPDTVDTIDETIEIITQIMWICSVGHASINFPQWEYMSYVPNYPLAIFRKPPTKSDEIKSEAELLSALPKRSETGKQILFARILTIRSESKLGYYVQDTGYPLPPPFVNAVAAFQQDLEAVTGQLVARNAGREVPYPYIEPQLIPNSTAI